MTGRGINTQLVITTALVAVFASYGRRAYAACTNTGSTFTCAGPTVGAQTLNANNAAIATESDFALTSVGNGISSTGQGVIGFKDNMASTITATGGVGLAINSTGDITGPSATSGSVAVNVSGSISAQTGMVTANSGSGGTTLNIGGRITGTGTAVGDSGVRSSDSGSGASIINVTGDVISAGQNALRFTQSGSGDLSITTSANSSIAATSNLDRSHGISVYNSGSGTTMITVNGAVSSAATTTTKRQRSAGVGLTLSGAGAGTISTGVGSTVSGGSVGIYGNILQTASPSASMTFDLKGQTNGSYAGVLGFGFNGALLKVTSDAHSISTGARGITMRAYNTGAVDITHSGEAYGTGAGHGALEAFTAAGSIDVTTSSSSVSIGLGYGILALNSRSAAAGDGAITIDANGVVTGTDGSGIFVTNSRTGATKITTESGGVVKGGQNGISAQNKGTGSLTITANGSVKGTAANGIYGTGLASIAITANADVTGGQIGIFSNNLGDDAAAVVVGLGGLVQGSAAGVEITAGPTNNVATVTNSGIIRNTSRASDALAIESSGNVGTSIVNTGLVLGTVNLGNIGNNSFDNKSGGTWNTAGGTNEFDPGPNTVNNRAGGLIIAANNPAAAQITTFNGLATFTNAGTITMGDGFAGDRTVVTGNFVGQGGTIILDTFLGTDGAASDRLVLNGGTASGNTFLDIRNTTGPGAQTYANGIEVIEADDGATTTATAFRLSHAVSAGAYDYDLYHGGIGADATNENWYLRNILAPINPQQPGKPLLSPTTQTSLPYPGTLINFGTATLGTLQQRTGNRIWPNGTPAEPLQTIWCKDPAQNYHCTVNAAQESVYQKSGPVLYGQGAWGRIGGQYGSYDPKVGVSYSQTLGFLQAGYEGNAYEGASGDVTLGGYALVGTSRSRIDLTPDPVSGASRGKGTITTNGYGGGVNATYLGSNGFYADAVAQFLGFSSDLSNKNGGDNQGWASTLSLEAGQRFELGSGWAVVPQAQLAWTHADFSSFNDAYGNAIAMGKGDSLQGRAGLRVENLTNWKDDVGQPRRLQLYGIANIHYEFLNGTSIKVNEVTLDQRNQPLWGEVGVGGTYAWNDKWSLYGEADYSHALSGNGSDNYIVSGQAGLRYKW